MIRIVSTRELLDELERQFSLLLEFLGHPSVKVLGKIKVIIVIALNDLKRITDPIVILIIV